jgi:hypothetical protein
MEFLPSGISLLNVLICIGPFIAFLVTSFYLVNWLVAYRAARIEKVATPGVILQELSETIKTRILHVGSISAAKGGDLSWQTASVVKFSKTHLCGSYPCKGKGWLIRINLSDSMFIFLDRLHRPHPSNRWRPLWKRM